MKRFNESNYLLRPLSNVLAVLPIGCNKTSDEPGPEPVVSIAGVDPASTTITIGGLPATIVSVSPAQIIVTVPQGWPSVNLLFSLLILA